MLISREPGEDVLADARYAGQVDATSSETIHHPLKRRVLARTGRTEVSICRLSCRRSV